MAVLIDTSVLIDIERGINSSTAERLLGDEDCAISVVTMSELLHGAFRARRGQRARRRAFVEQLLVGIEAIPITEPIARIHAEVWAELARRGNTVGAHDLWIAATALAHGFSVATRDRADFARVPGLSVISV
ncbi:MAG: PIN domain-containing protein [Solirubrobacterales bacterium]